MYIYIYINIPWYTSTSQIYKRTYIYIYTYTNISRDRERCICACICATAHVHHKLTDRWRNYAGTTTKTKTTHEPANTINKEQSATDTSSCYRFVCGNSLRFMAKWWIIFLRVLIEAPLNGHLTVSTVFYISRIRSGTFGPKDNRRYSLDETDLCARTGRVGKLKSLKPKWYGEQSGSFDKVKNLSIE